MSQRRTLLLLVPHLGGGGSERVTLLLARELSKTMYDVHLGVLSPSGHPADCLPATATVHALGAKRVREAGPAIVRLVRSLKPDVLLSTAPHLSFLILMLQPFLPSRTRIVVRQSHMPSARFRSSRWPDNSRLLYRLLYPRADRVICQTYAMAADLSQHTGVPIERINVLPNPVGTRSIHCSAAARGEVWGTHAPRLVAIGRLAHEKGFDLLLEAFSSVRDRHPDALLCILGKGPQESRLREVARRLELGNSVHWAGEVVEPAIYFAGATCYVLSSRTEGLPNALLETAAAGLPLICTPCSGGVIDLLEGTPGVWIAREFTATALALSLLDAIETLSPGQRFQHGWMQEFQLSNAVARYEDLFDSLPVGPSH